VSLPLSGALGTGVSTPGVGLALGYTPPIGPGPEPTVRAPGNWASGFTPPVTGAVAGQILNTELEQIDGQLTGAINGDDGSTHSPAFPLEIQGAGMPITGLTTIARGGTLQCHSNPTIRCEANDFPEFGVGNQFATHQYLQPCSDFRGVPYNSQWRVRREDGGLQAISASFDLSDGNGQRPSFGYMRLRCHDGATLTSVVVTFRVVAPHAQLPTTMPALAVVRFDAAGNYQGSLTSLAASGNALGIVSVPSPASAAAWASGATQTIEIVCDQNNTIDISQYSYKLQILEEQGLTGYPFQVTYKAPVKVTGVLPFSVTANVPPYGVATVGQPIQGPATIDGISLANGDRVLVNHSLFDGSGVYPAFFNGIWVANTNGNWRRAPDFDSASDFSQGCVIPVISGAAHGGSFWQCAPSITSWSPAPSGAEMPGTVTQWSAQKLIRSGSALYPIIPTGFWYQLAGEAFNSIPGVDLADPIWPTKVGDTVGVSAVQNIQPWAPGTGYTANVSFVVPRTATGNNNFYICRSTGTSGATGAEPSWPGTYGSVVADNGASWELSGTAGTLTCAGATATPLTFRQKPDKSYPLPTDGFTANGIVWLSALLTHQVHDMRFA